MNIINAPRLLVFHLCRFTSTFDKIETFVEFPTEFSNEYNRDGNGQKIRYRLTGLIRHTGSSIASGHYIAYVLFEGRWYKANDELITEVSWQTVRTLQVYMLFYERV